MPELSQYQKQKQTNELIKGLDNGQKAVVLDKLLEEWVETLPRKGKDYGVGAGKGKWAERFEWLQEHWGTQFDNGKGSVALRRMPASGVLELLTLFALQAADSDDDELTFGSLEDGSELGEKVASGLSAMKEASGPQVAISLGAFNELQRIRREYQEAGGTSDAATSTKVLQKIFDQLQAMPSVKDEKETARYEKRKAAGKKGG
ncbi:hypothetical protein KBY72_13935 [Cyanobium sp. BA5m-21]|uniref:hypothetical protein n=1 Tax=unclassified Cyanobium TaxID=2627006 RepID=UPI0020CD6BBE|nr:MULTISPECIES: hypothetical protein [unclassified Cyanobium]MCP9903118.1 hypothetical protein [Cyanobium sp. BA5m-10]MCP9908259.1 hypothetical protein [Cyanobium sp. BA5m-21]